MPLHIGGHLKDLDDLPQANLPDHAVMYKEPTSIDDLVKILTPWTLAMLAFFLGLFIGHAWVHQGAYLFSLWPILLFLPGALVHEGIHLLAMPRKADKYLYWKPEAGMAMVTMTDPMSPSRFIFVSLLPLILLGLIPLGYSLLAPIGSPYMGTAYGFGALMCLAAIGDLYNVANTITQVPKGALVQLSGMNTYWYIP